MKKKILIIGFGPFGEEKINPALEVIKALNSTCIMGMEVIGKEVSVVRQKAIDEMTDFIHEVDPEIVIAVGQAGGRVEITPERVAINVDDFRIKDNEGNQPIDEPVICGAPTAYLTTLPIKSIVECMRAAGIPASVSSTAGTFVCNHLFYGLMHFLANEGNMRRGGFIHIPYLPEQAARIPGQPSMSLEKIIQGLTVALETTIRSEEDSKIIGGTEC